MVKKYPFHAHLLQPDRFQCDSEVGTIVVTIRNCKLRFLYSPEFVSDCEFAELIGLLHHAVNHILFEHPFVLRRFVARATESQPSLHRVPRRFPDLVGIVLGRSHSTNRLNVMAVIDTSVSMTTDLLEQIGGELRFLSRDCNIIVVECDTEIREVYRFQREIIEIHGRGGTDLRPPFERKFLAQHRADVLLYFTDREEPAPKSPPAIPVLWCLTPSEIKPTEWGKVVELGE